MFGTFMTSAFWHGIYLSYYVGNILFYFIGFLHWAILTHLTKFFYKMSFYLPKSFRESWAAIALVYVLGMVSMTYLAMGVVVLEW